MNCRYIGETDRNAVDRFKEHKGCVVNQKIDTSSGEHFNLPGHNFSDIKLLLFEKVHGDALIRKRRENNWINIYDSKHNGGNKR